MNHFSFKFFRILITLLSQTEHLKRDYKHRFLCVRFFVARSHSDLYFIGALSHSGRRTFIRNVTKKISAVGGSMRDVQSLAGHSNLQTTQRYIEVDTQSQPKVIDLI